MPQTPPVLGASLPWTWGAGRTLAVVPSAGRFYGGGGGGEGQAWRAPLRRARGTAMSAIRQTTVSL